MKIVVFELEEWEHEAFRNLSQEYDVVLTDINVGPGLEKRYTDADIISTFIYSQINSDTLSQFPKLKMISTRSTGFDHIDLAYCREHDITVCNVPDYANETVAEHVFALLMGISHKIIEAVGRTRSGVFTAAGLEGFDLSGKTLGVIGTGAIGRHAIKIAGGFGMKVIAFDMRPNEEAAKQLGFRYVSLDELLAQSDVVSIHIPGTPATQNYMDREKFSKMKKGAVLINTARGSLVDNEALLEALVNQKLGAAGLDVLPEEPTIREEAELLRSVFTRSHKVPTLFANLMLAHLPNVLITPHTAFYTREATQRLINTTLENIQRFIEGKPQNAVLKPG